MNIISIFLKKLKMSPLFFITFSLILTSYYIWTWSPVLAQLGGDNATYYLTANFFSPYLEPLPHAELFAKSSKYPPLFPVLLGLSGGGNSILLAHLITTTFLLLSFLVMYQFLILLKFGNFHASVLVFIFSIIPGTYFQALSIHSENIYILFSLLAVFFVTLKEEKNNAKYLLIAAVFIACGTLCRSVGFVLALAFIIYLLINREQRKLFLALIALLPMAAWNMLFNKSSSSYSSELFNHYSLEYFTVFFRKVVYQFEYMLHAWFSTFSSGSFGHSLLIVFLCVCSLGVCYRLYNKKLDGIYVILYISMIIVWPFPAESMRLLFPVIPLLIFQASLFIKFITSKLNFKENLLIGNIVIEGALLILLIPTLILTIERFNIKIDENIQSYKRTNAWYDIDLNKAVNDVNLYHEILSGFKQAKEYIPEGECVYNIKPSIASLHMQRNSKRPPLVEVNDEEFYRLLEQSGCSYFYLMSVYSPSYRVAFYPLERMGEKLEIMKVDNSYHNNKKYTVTILAKLKD